MSIARWGMYIGFIVLVLLGIVFGARSYAQGAVEGRITVRWLLSHSPTEVFDRASKTFAAELKRESEGRLVLEIVTPEDLGVSERDFSYTEVKQRFANGEADIASVYTSALAVDYEPLEVIDMPFLFSNYEHVERVLDGEIGASLLEGLNTHSDVRGLAFTLSGGWRIFASKSSFALSPKEFKGKTIAALGGPLVQKTLGAFGADAIPVPAATDVPDADLIETTYSRFLSEANAPDSARFVSETGHSLFSTVIVANHEFFDALSETDKQALIRAARAAALVEREDSQALAVDMKKDLLDTGVEIRTPSAEQQSELERAARSIYLSYENAFGDLVERIQNLR